MLFCTCIYSVASLRHFCQWLAQCAAAAVLLGGRARAATYGMNAQQLQFCVVYTVRWDCIQDMLVRFSPKDVVHMFVDGALRRNDLIIVSWHCVYRVHVALCS